METLISIVPEIIAKASWELAGNIASLLFMVSMVIIVVKWHLAENSPVNLADLFLDDNSKIGSSKMRLNGAWILFSWVIIYTTIRGTLNEWMVGIYISAFVFDRMQARKDDAKPIEAVGK